MIILQKICYFKLFKGISDLMGFDSEVAFPVKK